MADIDSKLTELPEDSESLRALVQALLLERDQQQRQAEEQQRRVEEQQRRADEQSKQTMQLRAELARLQLELERYKKWYYGPRADRLRTANEVAQLLLNFAEELDRKPIAARRTGTWGAGRRTTARAVSQGASESRPLRASSRDHACLCVE